MALPHASGKSKLVAAVLLVTIFGTWTATYFRYQMRPSAIPQREAAPMRPDKSVEPFMFAKHNLSQDAFHWWKKLQYEKGSFDSFRTTLDRLHELCPPTPPFQMPNRLCAVVGNSVNLKGSKYGPLIDAHPVVIRMNKGLTKGYEEDVGSKTTHRVMYPESASDLDESTHLVLFPFKIQDINWLVKALTSGFRGTSYAPIKALIKANKDLVAVVNPGFMMYVHQAWLGAKGAYPSTGFMTLILAMHVCDEVHVFGFGADKDGNWSHYWEELRDKGFRTGIHPGAHEYNVIQQLAVHQKINFFKGS